MSTKTRRAIHKIKDALRGGGKLMRMHSKTPLQRWFLLNGRETREVDPEIAELVIREPDVNPNHDGMWLGCDQTYSMDTP